MGEPLGIEFSEQDRAGVVTLNRPSRLNALSREMFDALSAQYRLWAPNPHIYGVVMESTHPTVFSSGGDLKTLNEWVEQGALETIREFYRAAYTYVFVLEKFVRPNVPLINGLLLGGGVGITLYGTHCVAGEGYRMAMPQVGIGFLPDIGGTYFLSRLDNHIGLYLALTGRAIGPADAHRLALITHYIPAAHFHVIKDALNDNHPIDRLLDGLHRDPGEGELVKTDPRDHPHLRRFVGRGDSGAPGQGAGPGRSLGQGDRGRDAQEIANLSESCLCPDAARQDAEPRRGIAARVSPCLTIVARPDYREGIASRIVAKALSPAGARQRSQKSTTPKSSDCLRRLQNASFFWKRRSCDKRYLTNNRNLIYGISRNLNRPY